ncbi:tripartite tricarboxylate transporter TctB family protein [Microvirga lotononidis]|uniref:Tripartite tricarboxylate transporter TctB family n=1 Tax=Microvirga lotononidis TaxID=864069 RepID=I4YN46_9HYPH|nr:tripartite tricarboxylate transporter TctB family protein [Microvirga lotononidis]EIM25388.1 Tripartite tricarboxylate transporter TctB family [Microvirga lotononidis]WQO27315.1 tripartite tricarboxylate transporter TctB family protein [Microvirga lotononidis]
MSETVSGDLCPARAGPVRSPQSLVAGLTLVALAALSLWLISDLDQGTLQSMGPALLPRWLAIAVGLCGLVLVGTSFTTDGDFLERWSLRGPVFVIGSILAFALTIRGYSFGAFALPGLGLLVAGPLGIILGGYATPEARLRELVILALSLTPFCMVLFGDLLNLPIPVFPQALTSLFPADWSQKAVLRACAALMTAGAIVIFLATRNRHPGPVDVADHSGRI